MSAKLKQPAFIFTPGILDDDCYPIRCGFHEGCAEAVFNNVALVQLLHAATFLILNLPSSAGLFYRD